MRRRPEANYTDGPSLDDNSSGDPDNQTRPFESRERLEVIKKRHGLTEGRNADNLEYDSQPNTGGNGPEHAYSGGILGLEGGVRAGGDFETLPAQYPYPKKFGYDEHNYVPSLAEKAMGTVHGMSGVEGLPDSDSVDQGPAEVGTEHGMACAAHGCGFMAKTAHGLSRHMFAKHGGHGAMKHALKR